MKNKFSLIFLLSGLTALSANAADNAAKELKNPKPAVKAEASTAKPSAKEHSQKADIKKEQEKKTEKKLSANDVLTKLEAWDDRLKTLDADFTQEVWFKDMDIKQKVEGNLKYMKPNLLRLEHILPASQVITTDKKDILIYKPKDKQAIMATWDGWVKTQNQSFYGVLDFGNYSSLAKNNEVSLSGGAGGMPYKLTFTPKKGTSYKLTLTLASDDFFPSEAELEVGSAITSTKLLSVKKNISLDKKVFKQNLPEKTEIINFNK